MYDIAYLDIVREQVKNHVNSTNKQLFRKIQVNEENGLIYLEVHDFFQSQDYELHCFNPLYDSEAIIDVLVKNRIEILLRGQK